MMLVMNLMSSLVSLVSNVLKRFYLLIPGLLLDPFDVAQALGISSYEPTAEVAWGLVVSGLFLAILLAYDDLRRMNVTPIVKARRLLKQEITVGWRRVPMRTVLRELADELTNGMERPGLVAKIQNKVGNGEMSHQQATEVLTRLKRANILTTEHRPAIYDPTGRNQLQSPKEIDRLNELGNNLLDEV